MNIIFLRKGVLLPSLAAIAVLGTGLSATAQTIDQTHNQQLTEPSATATSPADLSTKLKANRQNLSTETTTNTNQALVSDGTASQQFPSATTQSTGDRILTPVPGTVATSSMALVSEYAEPTSSPSQPSTSKVAQSDIDLGRPTRGGSSYIGVAGNIGISGGDSSLGDGNFAVISKVGLTNAISVRPSAVFGDNTTILIPITYDFSFQQADPFSEPLAIAPYVGIGAAINTGDDSQVGFLASGGIDVPLNSQFTATAAVNAAFFDETDIGLLIGVGYNFTGF
ncbi:hypothetical protein I8751_14550 [Nostocaceae cyanobacterium CENA357]|uniref:Outer membrane protein beta-barrel domain-containing protein n=1 Tax=Atlanticothrix silvestris CENA357 TaxID=1725252 RepID=A0A8J7L2W3_9CYAN|nr:hypothetical protein [Atlanticothrix silvestris]MBH8553569.1 hypothetical protein [Atlanticothrix silvestris CENA357]